MNGSADVLIISGTDIAGYNHAGTKKNTINKTDQQERKATR